MLCLRTLSFEYQAISLIFATPDYTRLEIAVFLALLAMGLLILSEQPVIFRIGHVPLCFPTRE